MTFAETQAQTLISKAELMKLHMAQSVAGFVLAFGTALPAHAVVVDSFGGSDVWSLGGDANGEISGSVPTGRAGAIRLESGDELIADAWQLDSSVPTGSTMTWSFELYGPGGESPEIGTGAGLCVTETFGTEGGASDTGCFGAALLGGTGSSWYSAERSEFVPAVSGATEDYDLTSFALTPGVADGESLYINSATVTFDTGNGDLTTAAYANFGPQSTEVPIPATFLLIATGFAGLAGLCRFRKTAERS
jgi:hypothetical protein